MSPNMQTALRLAAAGLAVFPADPETKRPLCRFSVAATKLANGVRYFWGRYPTAAPALHLTACDLVAVDLDRGHDDGADGIACFDALLDQYGEIPVCPAVRTPRGGIHLYFRQPIGRDPLGNSAGHVAPSIDVRGWRGFTIAPGAVLATGEFYEGIAGTPDLVETFTAGTIPIIPAWLVELAERRPELPTREPSTGEPASDARGREWALAALDGEACGLALTQPGGRNHKLNAVVWRLATMAARGWLNENEVWCAAEGACRANGYLTSKDSSDGPARFRATYNSAFRAGFAKPALDPQERVAPAQLITLAR